MGPAVDRGFRRSPGEVPAVRKEMKPQESPALPRSIDDGRIPKPCSVIS